MNPSTDALSATMNPVKLTFKLRKLHRSGKVLSIHRFSGRYSHEMLLSVISHLIGLPREKFVLTYLDEEGDSIRIGCSLEWDECMRVYLRNHRDYKSDSDRADTRQLPPLRLDATHAKRSKEDAGPPSPRAVEKAPSQPASSRASSPEPDVEPLDCMSRMDSATQPMTEAESESPKAMAPPATGAAFVPVLKFAWEPPAPAPAQHEPVEAAPTEPAAQSGDAIKMCNQLLFGNRELMAQDKLLRAKTIADGNTLIDRDPPAAESLLKAAIQVWPRDPVLTYNLACALARQGQVDEAIGWLKTSIYFGFSNAVHMAEDPDLAALTGDPRFQELVSRVSVPRTRTTPRTQSEPSPDAVAQIHAIFPSLSKAEVITLLEAYKGNVQRAINSLLV